MFSANPAHEDKIGSRTKSEYSAFDKQKHHEQQSKKRQVLIRCVLEF